MTPNQIAYWQNQETIRANQAKEAENIRSNQAQERLKSEANRIESYNAKTKRADQIWKAVDITQKPMLHLMDNVQSGANTAVKAIMGLVGGMM